MMVVEMWVSIPLDFVEKIFGREKKKLNALLVWLQNNIDSNIFSTPNIVYYTYIQTYYTFSSLGFFFHGF